MAGAAAAAGGTRTRNPALQARLEELAACCARDDIRSLVKIFVPHDLTDEVGAEVQADCMCIVYLCVPVCVV